jgi:hypothetical protein
MMRLRSSMFMERIRKHGLLETISEHSFVINEKKLTDYLAVRAARQVCTIGKNFSQGSPILDRNLS